MCFLLCFSATYIPQNTRDKNLNEINTVNKSVLFIGAVIYQSDRQTRGKKTTTTLRLFKAAQLCFCQHQRCGVLVLKDLRLQGWKLVFVQSLDQITTQSNQHWLLRIAEHADHFYWFDRAWLRFSKRPQCYIQDQ